MKSTLLSIFCLYSVAVISQTKDTTLLIIPCKSGELIIDGYTKGRIDAEDAHPEKFSFGDHYIQLKTEEGKLNSAIKVSEALTSTIIRLDVILRPSMLFRLEHSKQQETPGNQ
ncbi:MAG: hypothetical protein WDO19_22715 [Bacteroidota bacterium]